MMVDALLATGDGTRVISPALPVADTACRASAIFVPWLAVMPAP